MRVLVACEYSAIVRDAFRERGHDAWSCDLLPTEGDPRYHIHGDITNLLDYKTVRTQAGYKTQFLGWDLMIAHPPCTYLCNSGVRWLYTEKDRIMNMVKARDFFFFLQSRSIPKICMENPIPHRHSVLPKYNQIVQPWMFGENESKATCLWLKGLPNLVPDVIQKPDNLEQRVWRMPPGPDRQKERSRFFRGIAKAMANQWGSE